MLYKTRIPSSLDVKEWYDTTQVAENNVKIEEHLQEDEMISRFSFPRNSFSCVKKNFVVDESSMPNSPIFPTFMSVRGKARSMSTPRQRTGFMDSDSHCEGRSLRSCGHDATSSANEENEVSQRRCQSVNRHYYR